MGWFINILKSQKLLVAIGFILLILLIWIVGSWFSLLTQTECILATVIVIFLWVLLLMFEHMKAARSAGSIEQSLNMQAEDQIQGLRPEKREEIELFKQQLTAAIEKLKKSKLGRGRSGKAALYALPWYMMIGAPAAGKTTAIKNSGLEFPLGNDELKGVGGTRNCDWFFSSSAIFLDTAGRYITEDEDKDEWHGFLNVLKKHRKRKPINGVIVGVSVADLLNANPEELEWHAKTVRRRVDELLEILGIRFPVYLVFTKCDMIQGFAEYFSTLGISDREQVWGCTLTEEQQKASNPKAVFSNEMQVLLDSLNKTLLARLNLPMKREERSKVYSFPIEFTSAQTKLADFIGKLFQPNPFHDDPVFRGFYFTSGTQEGIPIDQAIQEIAEKIGLPPVLTDDAGPATEIKHYFIKSLFADVIIPDQDYHAGATTRAGATKRLFRIAALAGSALALGLFIFGVSQDYINSKSQVERLANSAKTLETVNWSRGNIVTHLGKLDKFRLQIDKLQQYEKNPPFIRFGMNRGGDLLIEASALYFRKTNAFAKRYIYKNMLQTIDGVSQYDYDRVYANLKAYLLLTTEKRKLQQDTTNRTFLRKNFYETLERDLLAKAKSPETLVPLLQRNIHFFVDIMAERNVAVFQVDERRLRRARRSIYRPPTIESIYQRVISEGENRMPDAISLSALLGGRHREIFNGNPQINGVFTKRGWENYVEDAIKKESKDPGRDDWVIGIKTNEIPAELRDHEKIAEKLTKLYFRDYARAWWDFLDAINYQSFNNITKSADRLRILSDPRQSPIFNLLKYVSEETSFQSQITKNTGGFIGGMGKKLGFNNDDENALVNHPSDKEFSRLHTFINGSDDQNQLTICLGQLSAMNGALDALQGQPENAVRDYAAQVLQQRSGELPTALREINRSLNTLDLTAKQAIRKLFEEPVTMAWQAVLNNTQNYLNSLWNTKVYDSFKGTLANYYPFRKDGTDVPVEDVEQFFRSEDGILWLFFEEELKPFIRKNNWQAYQWENRGIAISTNTTKTLRTADDISKSLFRNGNLEVPFRMQPNLPQIDSFGGTKPVVTQVCLTLNGEAECYRMGFRNWIDLTWPSLQGTPNAVLSMTIKNEGTFELQRFENDWALFRLLDSASSSKRGGYTYKLRWPYKRTSRYDVEVIYSLQASGSKNPFKRNFFSRFRCPRQLN